MANGQVGVEGTAESCLGTHVTPPLAPTPSLRKGTTTPAAGCCSVHCYTPCRPASCHQAPWPESMAGSSCFLCCISRAICSLAWGLLPDEGNSKNSPGVKRCCLRGQQYPALVPGGQWGVRLTPRMLPKLLSQCFSGLQPQAGKASCSVTGSQKPS